MNDLIKKGIEMNKKMKLNITQSKLLYTALLREWSSHRIDHDIIRSCYHGLHIGTATEVKAVIALIEKELFTIEDYDFYTKNYNTCELTIVGRQYAIEIAQDHALDELNKAMFFADIEEKENIEAERIKQDILSRFRLDDENIDVKTELPKGQGNFNYRISFTQPNSIVDEYPKTFYICKVHNGNYKKGYVIDFHCEFEYKHISNLVIVKEIISAAEYALQLFNKLSD